MNKKVKQQNGITLIALVITIIILIILAGITINLSIGQKGILTRAQEAGKNYAKAANDEEQQLEKIYSGNWNINTLEDMLKECNLDTTYTIKDIVENKDSILEKILENENAINYILSKPDDYLEAFANSEIALTIISKQPNIKEKLISNENWLNGIQQSSHVEKFDENMKTIPIMTSNNTPSGEVIPENHYFAQYFPQNAFDGNKDTSYYVNNTINNTIIYKYDEMKLIYKIDTNIMNPASNASSNVFRIYISSTENEDDWEEVLADIWSWPNGQFGIRKDENVSFTTAKKVRRIKIYMYCNSGANIDTHLLSEVQAYGI